jgi:hypothetical protein
MFGQRRRRRNQLLFAMAILLMFALSLGTTYVIATYLF